MRRYYLIGVRFYRRILGCLDEGVGQMRVLIIILVFRGVLVGIVVVFSRGGLFMFYMLERIIGIRGFFQFLQYLRFFFRFFYVYSFFSRYFFSRVFFDYQFWQLYFFDFFSFQDYYRIIFFFCLFFDQNGYLCVCWVFFGGELGGVQ